MVQMASADVPEPLSIRAFQQIRRGIITGHYPQGSVLHEQRIAEELNLSRVPLREAVPMLDRAGFIEARPRRSSIVTTWTAELIEHLFDVRLALEVAAAGAAARRVARGVQQLDLAEAVTTAQHRLENDSEPLGQAEANSLIHSTLVAAAGNPLMDDLMRSLSGRMTWLFYLTSSRDLGVQSHEHFAILDAVLAGNDRLAEALTYSHIEDGREPSLKAVGG